MSVTAETYARNYYPSSAYGNGSMSLMGGQLSVEQTANLINKMNELGWTDSLNGEVDLKSANDASYYNYVIRQDILNPEKASSITGTILYKKVMALKVEPLISQDFKAVNNVTVVNEATPAIQTLTSKVTGDFVETPSVNQNGDSAQLAHIKATRGTTKLSNGQKAVRGAGVLAVLAYLATNK